MHEHIPSLLRFLRMITMVSNLLLRDPKTQPRSIVSSKRTNDANAADTYIHIHMCMQAYTLELYVYTGSLPRRQGERQSKLVVC